MTIPMTGRYGRLNRDYFGCNAWTSGQNYPSMFCSETLPMLRQLPLFLVRSFGRSRSVTFLRHRASLGDMLMVTALVRGLKKTRPDIHIAIVSRRPELFIGNPHVDENRGWHLWRAGFTTGARYSAKDLAGDLHAVEIQWRSLWRAMADTHFPGVNDAAPPALDGVHPEIFLSAAERDAARVALGIGDDPRQPRKPIVFLSSGGKLKPTHNREWGIENYQAVADALSPYAQLYWISGEEPLSAQDQPLPDLRMVAVRHAAALFALGDAVLVQEGGLMHVARAVNAPCVSIYGGSLLPRQTGYAEQTNLSSQPECSPCIHLVKNCGHLKCMVDITPRRVLAAVATHLRERCGFELPQEAFLRTPETWTPPRFVDLNLLKQELALN